MRSIVKPMNDVVKMARQHFAGIVAWAQNRQTNDFVEALNGLLQCAKRKARGYSRTSIIRSVIFLLAVKLPYPEL
jgi:transposase